MTWTDRITGKMGAVKGAIIESADILNDKRAAEVRARWLNRWMERTREIGKECNGPDDIDYSD